MFTLQNQQLDALLQDVPSTSLLTINQLKEMLGNCQQPLEHRAPITIDINPNDSRPAILQEIGADVSEAVSPSYAGLQVNNWTGYVEPQVALPNVFVKQGWAAIFQGPVNIRANIFNFAPRRIALVVQDGIWANDLYSNYHYDHEGDPFWAMSGRWAVAQGDSTTGSPDYVTCKFCDDASGTGVGGIDVTVILPERSGVAHKVSTGDVILVGRAKDGTYACISDYSGITDTEYPHEYDHNGTLVGKRDTLNFVDTSSATFTVTDDGGNDRVNVSVDITATVLWGKAQHQWAKNSGSPIVSLRAVPGYPSSTTESGSAFDCSLPNPNTAEFDPNVIKGQYIPYKLDDSGNAVCVGSYLGPKIKTARWYLGDPDDLVITESTKNISGWGWMDGTANASGNGGTGINAKGYYSFNSDTDTGAISASELTATGSHTHGGNTDGTFTGITADAHPSHIHRVMTHCGTCQLWECSSGQSTYLITGFQDDHSAGNNSVWTGIQKLYSTDHTVDHDDLTLSHTINDPGHYHANDMDASHSDPNKFKMYLVERLDNSFETLSI